MLTQISNRFQRSQLFFNDFYYLQMINHHNISMKTILPIICAFLILSCQNTSPVQETSKDVLTEASPESVNMSAGRINKIDAMLKKEVENEQIPGAVALIARKGKIVYHSAIGMSDVSSEVPFKRDDIFRIASQTKAITATAVMILWEEGHFRLDQPISDFIPEFKDPQVLDSFVEEDSSYTTKPASKEITIRHLITHTSGIGYGMIDNDTFRKIYQKAGVTDLFTTEPVSIEESVKILAVLPLHHNPGEKFTYSEGLDVLGYFIEIVSGMKFDEFLRTRIFDPLGMDDTWFYLPEEKHNRLVPVQHREDDEWAIFPETFYDPDYPKKGAMTFFSGGAGLSSTALDYAKFLQMYLNEGIYNGNRILSPTTIRTIMSNQTGDLLDDYEFDYGLAFGVSNEKAISKGGRGSIGTFDWGGYFNTQYFADPELDVIGILMKQTQGVGEPTSWKFRRMVFSAVEELE